MMYHDSGPFQAVICTVDESPRHRCVQDYVRMTPRENIQDAKDDLVCYFNLCQCSNPKNKNPRNGPCQRGYPRPANVTCTGFLDYIDNARGFRALPTKV